MFILHGNYSKSDRRGTVADVCPACKNVRTFQVVDHFQRLHVYFIPAGSWQFVMSTKICTTCQAEFPCAKADYDVVVPPSSQQMPFDELLKLSNPKLLATIRLDAFDELEYAEPIISRNTDAYFDSERIKAAPVETEDNDSDSELQQLLFKLTDYDMNDPDLFKLREKLKFWRHLGDDKRAALARKVSKYCDKQERIQEAKQFIIGISPTFPSRTSNIGCLFALLVIGASYPVMDFLPILWTWYWTLAYFPCVFICVFFLFGIYTVVIENLWFNRILRTAGANGIRTKEILHAVRAINSWSEDEKIQARNIVSRQRLILEFLSKAEKSS